MAHKKAAIKYLRKSRKLYDRHQSIVRQIKDLRKKINRAAEAKDKTTAVDLYKKLQKILDKASKAQGFLKKNSVARYKARAMKKINAIVGAK